MIVSRLKELKGFSGIGTHASGVLNRGSLFRRAN
jgi:hypothetical protein